MGISGLLEYRLFKGDDPVPSLEYEGQTRWQLTSSTLIQTINVGEDVKKRQPSCNVGVNIS